MEKKIIKTIDKKLNQMDKLANEKFIDLEKFKLFKTKLNEFISKKYETTTLEIKDCIDIEVVKLIKNYNYYNFNGTMCYTKPNSKAEKELYKFLGL